MAKHKVRKRLHSEERRAIILRAALRIFGSSGYRDGSMAAIAEAAGVTKPVLYDHFPSKLELYRALVAYLNDDLAAKGAAAMQNPGTTVDRIRKAVDAFFLLVEDAPEMVQILFIIPKSEPELRDLSHRQQAEVRMRMAAMLKGEFSKGRETAQQLQRFELFAEFLKEGMHGLALWWLEHPGVKRQIITDAVVKAVCSGIAPSK